MDDYPRNLTDFDARFATEQACRDYLFQAGGAPMTSQ
jgi:hypothetical protein